MNFMATGSSTNIYINYRIIILDIIIIIYIYVADLIATVGENLTGIKLKAND